MRRAPSSPAARAERAAVLQADAGVKRVCPVWARVCLPSKTMCHPSPVSSVSCACAVCLRPRVEGDLSLGEAKPPDRGLSGHPSPPFDGGSPRQVPKPTRSGLRRRWPSCASGSRTAPSPSSRPSPSTPASPTASSSSASAPPSAPTRRRRPAARWRWTSARCCGAALHARTGEASHASSSRCRGGEGGLGRPLWAPLSAPLWAARVAAALDRPRPRCPSRLRIIAVHVRMYP